MLIKLTEGVTSLTQTYLVGDTTSKQKRRSMSSQCLTVHSLRSSTTTVGLSCRHSRGTYIQQQALTSFTTKVIVRRTILSSFLNIFIKLVVTSSVTLIIITVGVILL